MSRIPFIAHFVSSATVNMLVLHITLTILTILIKQCFYMLMNLCLMVDHPGSQSSLPSYNEATEEPAKKKIIPVQVKKKKKRRKNNPGSENEK